MWFLPRGTQSLIGENKTRFEKRRPVKSGSEHRVAVGEEVGAKSLGPVLSLVSCDCRPIIEPLWTPVSSSGRQLTVKATLGATAYFREGQTEALVGQSLA